MPRFILILTATFALAYLPGCSCGSERKPLTAEQEHQLHEELRKVEEQERMHLQ
ncbi:MAG: hypothetical protein U1E05_09520 [Patescibacteria group bacterium]|nr:hypothetical protein [Patescibacteria group bacterium]